MLISYVYNIADSLIEIQTKINSIYQKTNSLDRTLTSFYTLFKEFYDYFIGLAAYIMEYFDWDNVSVEFGLEGFPNFFYNAETVFNNINDFIEQLKQEKVENSDPNNFSNTFNTLINDDSTVFGAWHSTSEALKGFVNNINGEGSSTISVPLKSTTFMGAKLGGSSFSISNGWYSDYKQYGDSIISAFIWLSFIFSLFSQLGNIIEGNGMKIRSIRAEIEYNDYLDTNYNSLTEYRRSRRD